MSTVKNSPEVAFIKNKFNTYERLFQGLGEDDSILINKTEMTKKELEVLCNALKPGLAIAFRSIVGAFEVYRIPKVNAADWFIKISNGEFSQERSQDAMTNYIEKAKIIINEYLTLDINTVKKYDPRTNIAQFQKDRVISKTYLQRKVSPFIKTSKYAKELNETPKETLNKVINALIMSNVIVELSSEQKTPYNTNAAVYGII